jgi:YHS domain-containing protein
VRWSRIWSVAPRKQHSSNRELAMTVHRIVTLSIAATVALGGCAAMNAQNPGLRSSPVNAVMEGDKRVMLKGYDVVAYFTQNRHAMGSPQFESLYEGVTYRFASAEHRALFDKEPAKYQPQYGGYCANGIVYAIPWGGDGDTWLLVDGKLYINGGSGSKAAFMLDVPGNIALADKYWAGEVSSNHSFWQRAKRLVFRVPHYKSGKELERMVQESAAKKG